MSEFIEILSPNTEAQLRDIMPLVEKLANHIKTINGYKASYTPSGADKGIQNMNTAYKNQGDALNNIKTSLGQVNEKKAKSASLTTQEKVDNAIILKQEKQKATLTSAYADAYAKLNTQRTIAKTKLQDLIASEQASNAEIRKAQKEFDVLNKKVAAADKAVGRFSDANRKINGLTQSVGNLMTAFGIGTGLYLAVDIVKGLYDTTKALQSMDLALKMVSETPLELAKNQQFVTETAEKWGLEIKTLQQTFTQFYTASKGLLSDESIKTTFEGIAKAGSVMGLSLEKQQAAFYAIDQMMSKGTVTAEELKKQLGNAMPGAIKAAAMAYMELHPAIKTIQEAEKALYEDMKKGAIDSATYVPLIAKNFQILYGIESLNSVHTMQAAQNRLQNSWTEWIRGLSSGGTGLKMIVSVMESLAKNLSTVITTLAIGATGWLAYKTAVMLASVQTKLVATYTALTTVATVEQTVATGFMTTATNMATAAWTRLKAAMASNIIGVALLVIGGAITIFNHFNKSIEEVTANVKEANNAFITNREIVTETIIENKRLIDRYEKLKIITKKSKEEQIEYNDVLAKLSKQVPDAITGVNNYGVAVSISTELIKKHNEGLQEELRLKSKLALIQDRELLPSLESDIAKKKKDLKDLYQYQKIGAEKVWGEDIDVTVAKAELALQISKNELSMAKERIKSMKGLTDAEKTKITADKKIKEEEIKNVEWYDKKIADLEKTKEGFTKRGEGLEYQKQLKQLQKERAYILGEEEKVNKAGIKAEKDAAKEREQLLKEEYDLKMSYLEIEKVYAKDKISLTEEVVQNEKIKMQDLIDATIYYNNILLSIEKTKYDEELRLAGKNESLKEIATNKFRMSVMGVSKETDTAILNIKKEHSKNITDVDNKMLLNLEINSERFKEIEEKRKIALKEQFKETSRLFNEFAGDFASKSGFSQTFDNFFKENKDGVSLFDKLFDKDSQMEAEERTLAMFLTISSAAQDMMNLIADNSQQKYENELNRNEKAKQFALKNAGDSTAAKEKIELDFEKKKKAIELRQFKSRQKMAIANIAIDTAQAIMSIMSTGGGAHYLDFGASAGILTGIVTAMGLAQIGMVAAQKPPEYWKGTDNAEAGLAWTQENGTELVLDKNNRIKSFGSDSGAQLTMMEKGDKVKTASETQKIMFNSQLNNLLLDNGIKDAKIEIINQGLTIEQMDSVLSKHFANITTQKVTFDNNGIRQWSERNGNITIRNESRGSGQGFSV